MTVRNIVLRSAIALALFASAASPPRLGVASARPVGQYFYAHPKLGFSFEYSAKLTAHEFPNGVGLTDDSVGVRDRFQILVTDTSLEDKNYPNRAASFFDRFRAAEAGRKLTSSELGRGTFIKIANLKVDGYQAVRVAYEPEPLPRQAPAATGDVPELTIPDAYAVSVYIRKGGDVWEVTSTSLERGGLEAGAKTFEEVLGTLKFSSNEGNVD